jgi:hypothetical protein
MDRLNTRVHFTSTLFFSMLDFLSETDRKPNNMDAMIDVTRPIKVMHIDMIEHACSIVLAEFLLLKDRT